MAKKHLGTEISHLTDNVVIYPTLYYIIESVNVLPITLISILSWRAFCCSFRFLSEDSHKLTLGLKVVWLGGTDFISIGRDFRLFVPLVNVILDSHFSQPWA